VEAGGGGSKQGKMLEGYYDNLRKGDGGSD